MKKSIMLMTFSIFLSFHSFAQENNYPKGVYLSFGEIKAHKPSENIELEVEKRSMGNIKMNGGNDYKLISNSKSIKKNYIKKTVFAYSTGDTLFLNCFQLRLQTWYTPILSSGKYLVFKAGISQNQDEYKKQIQIAGMFGAIGGGIAGAKLATLRFLYAYDIKNNIVITITPDSLEKLLSTNQNLLDDYLKEQNKDCEDIQIKYLKNLNHDNK